MRTKGLYLSCTLALALMVGVLWLLSGMPPPVYAGGADAYSVYYVHPSCTGIPDPCFTRVQSAVDSADDAGDVIRVATGIYTDAAGTVATISKTVSLLGGWNSGFTARDPDGFPSVLDAEGNGRVIRIDGSVSPTIDGFTITGGNANSETIGAGEGGGIYSKDASPIIQNNVIISNVASISPTTGSGGGIYLEGASASALISGNQVVSNTACEGWSAYGGGVYVGNGDATIQGNLILSNTSGRDGGGVYTLYASPRFLDNEIRANVAVRNGGGMFLDHGFPLVQDNLIIGNLAGRDGSDWHGGGMFVDNGSPTIVANQIFSNSAFSSGGLGLETGEYFTVTNNFIAHNNAAGIRLWEFTRYGLIAHNTIVFNGGEGGIRLNYPYITPTIVNNIVVSNAYGISAHTDASGTLDYNNVWGNTTQDYDLPGALEPGPHDIQADPLFVDPASDDFHLQVGSPCIDAGTDLGVMSDIDGDPRPVGVGYDIGADELRRYICLPLVERSYP